MRKLDRRGEVLSGCSAIELVKDAVFSLPMPLRTLLSITSAQTFSGTWRDHEKRRDVAKESGLKELSADGVMRKLELASLWPSRRGWLPEAVA